ncbi:hypothetical protein OAT67_06065 [Bacteriovoracaceae bacterium]|nr:hypothetical protein [Bacteriovoracaceae bacterium]|tara:strand:- start:145003 stop:145143 length:141 start_codon:yes stop_codon:yes gene_type:complete
MNKHEIENLIAKISMGWKLYKSSDDQEMINEIKKQILKLQTELEEK